MSINSGTTACMRKASSYWAIRVARFGVAESAGLELVEVAERIEAESAERAVHALGVGEVEDRIAAGAALHALVDRRQKAVAPVALAGAGERPARDEDDEAGQIAVLGAEAVGDPRAKRGPAALRGMPVKSSSSAGPWLNWSVCIDLMKRQIVGDLGQPRQRGRDPGAASGRAVRNFCGVPRSLGTPAGEGEATCRWMSDSGQSWPLRRDQFRLVIEQVEVRRTARHAQEDDVLDLRREVRRPAARTGPAQPRDA